MLYFCVDNIKMYPKVLLESVDIMKLYETLYEGAGNIKRYPKSIVGRHG
jgi:hypothetical protein